MISALRSPQASYGESEMPKEMAAFGISGRFGAGFARLFASHPPLPERIAALEEGV